MEPLVVAAVRRVFDVPRHAHVAAAGPLPHRDAPLVHAAVEADVAIHAAVRGGLVEHGEVHALAEADVPAVLVLEVAVPCDRSSLRARPTTAAPAPAAAAEVVATAAGDAFHAVFQGGLPM